VFIPLVVSSVSKSLGKTNSLRSSSSLQRKGTLRNVVFADEPNGRRKKAITHIQNLQKEYEQTKHENTKRKVFSRPSTVREEKSGPLTFDSLLGEAHLPESDVPRSSWVSFDRNPLKSLFTSRKKKMEGLIQNGVSTDKLVPVEEPVAVVDKRLSGIINDKAGLLHIQRSFSLQRYSSINGNNNPKLRNILKKHSIKKASFEIQALLRKLKTHHNKPTVLSKSFTFI